MRGEVLAGAPQEVRVSFPRERLFGGGGGIGPEPVTQEKVQSEEHPSAVPTTVTTSRPEGEKRRDGRGI